MISNTTHLETWPKIIAHRGAKAIAPENTLSAFAKAKSLGFPWVEFDVQLAKCGTPIVIHDETLERTTNGKGSVKDYTYKELCLLDAGSWFNAAFSSEKIPSLSQVIYFLATHEMSAVFELKSTADDNGELAKTTISHLKNLWPAYLRHTIISGFSFESTRATRRYDNEVALAISAHQCSDFEIDLIAEVKASSIHLHYKAITAEQIELLHQHQQKIFAYTINDTRIAKQLFDKGVDAIFSDVPDELTGI